MAINGTPLTIPTRAWRSSKRSASDAGLGDRRARRAAAAEITIVLATADAGDADAGRAAAAEEAADAGRARRPVEERRVADRMKRRRPERNGLMTDCVRPVPSSPARCRLRSAPRSQGAQITPNYKDADIPQIIEAVSEITGKTLHRRSARAGAGDDAVLDPDVAGRLLRGLPVDPAGARLRRRAVRQRDQDHSGRECAPVAGQRSAGPRQRDSDEFVTQVIQVRNVSAAQLVPILRPLVPQYGHLVAYPASNMLIISDRAANVSRMMRIIQRIDQAATRKSTSIRLEHASRRRDRARRQRAVQRRAGGGCRGRRPQLVADDRTNSVLISGESRSACGCGR